MPAQALITLNTVDYGPRGTENGIAKWQSVGGAEGQFFNSGPSIVTESVRGPLSNGNTKTRWVLSIPNLASADTTCACLNAPLGTAKVDVVIDIPSSLTSDQRQDLVDRFQALVALTVFDVSVSTPEGSWG